MFLSLQNKTIKLKIKKRTISTRKIKNPIKSNNAIIFCLIKIIISFSLGMVWEAIIHMKDVFIAGNSIHINYYIFVSFFFFFRFLTSSLNTFSIKTKTENINL